MKFECVCLFALDRMAGGCPCPVGHLQHPGGQGVRGVSLHRLQHLLQHAGSVRLPRTARVQVHGPFRR